MRTTIRAAIAAVTILASTTAHAQTLMSPARSAAETVWHLRAALNVAALGCRGPGEAATVTGYNTLLASERAVLAEALTALSAEYRARYGTAWQARFDDAMTRLYNQWARPEAHDAFCTTADSVLADAALVAPADFPAFAAVALPRMEAPFVAPSTESEAAPVLVAALLP